MKTHESKFRVDATHLLRPVEYYALRPAKDELLWRGSVRPLNHADNRFAREQRYAPVHPQLRLDRLAEVPQSTLRGFFGLYTAAPTKVSEITVTPRSFIRSVRKIGVDKDALLSKGIVPINVSDLDGTLWKEPIADILVYGKLCHERKLKPVIREKLDELLAEMKLTPATQLEDKEVLALMAEHSMPVSGKLDRSDACVNLDVLRAKAWFDEHKSQFSREELEDWSRTVYPLTSWSLAGFTVSEVQNMTRDIVRARNLKNVAFRGARRKVVALKRAGIPTALFSASNTILAQAAVDEIFGTRTPLPVTGTDVRVDENGVLTTEVINGGPCFRENKLRKVEDFLQAYVIAKHPGYDSTNMRPLLASGDSPSKTDEQMMEYAIYACADEPGTKRDVEIAMQRARDTGRYFILDFLWTNGGKPADKFQVDSPYGGAAGAL